MDTKTNRKMVDSGVEWIGEMPEGWDVERLGLLAKIETGSMNTEDRVDDGAYPLYVRSQQIEMSDRYTHDTEAILVPGEGLIGQIFHLAKGKHAVHQRVYSVQPSRMNSIDFIRYSMIAGFGKWAKENSNTVTVESLRRPTFTSFVIPQLPLPLQQAIANYLDHHVTLIDEERDLIARKIELLKGKRSALIFELVTGKRTLVEAQHLAGVDDWSNIVGSGEMMAVPSPRADDPFAKSGRLVDSGVEWIGEMPEGWGTLRLSDLFESAKRGATPSYLDESDFLIVNQACISGYTLNMTRAKPAKQMTGQRGSFKKGDILLASTGGGVMGKCALADRDGYCDSHVTIMKSKEAATSRLVFYWFSASFDWLQQFGKGSTNQIELQQRELAQTPFPAPSHPLQQSIADFLDFETGLIDKEIDLLTRKNELLSEQRKALIFEAVTGKIEIRE